MLTHQLRMGATSHIRERLRDELQRAGGDALALERLDQETSRLYSEMT